MMVGYNIFYIKIYPSSQKQKTPLSAEFFFIITNKYEW